MSKKLRAPKGTTEVNYGETAFPVNTDGTVEVPDDAAPALIDVGGCEEIDLPAVEVPDGHVALTAPAGCEACSVGGVSYAVSNGVVTVPLVHAAGLLDHGFAIAPAAEPAPTEPAKTEPTKSEPAKSEPTKTEPAPPEQKA